jgi:hypothetical protein
MLEEYTRVKTLVKKEGFPVGTKGVIVSMYSSGPACEVEVWDETDYPVDVVTYMLSELEAVD